MDRGSCFFVYTPTPLEKLLITYSVQGATTKELATEFQVANRTVKAWFGRLYSRLGITGDNRLAKLIEWAKDRYGKEESFINVPPLSPAAKTRPKDQLDPKDKIIANLVTKGWTNKEIAAQMGTTEQVIKNRLMKVYDAVGCSTRLELAVMWNATPPAPSDPVTTGAE